MYVLRLFIYFYNIVAKVFINSIYTIIDKMAVTVDRGDDGFEGLPAMTAVYLAVIEDSGVADILRRRCKERDLELASKGVLTRAAKVDETVAFKAFTGTYMTNGQRYPLYEVRRFYSSAPTDVMFGPKVLPRSLSDTNLAAMLDRFMTLDTEAFVLDTARAVSAYFGLKGSDDLFFDGTDVDFDGLAREDQAGEGVAVMRLSGKCKSKKTGLLHKEVMHVCDGNGVGYYIRPFDGATADAEMDLAAIGSLKGVMDPGRTIISGDCKMCDARILRTLDEGGIAFVTKVPRRFSDGLREKIRASALGGPVDESSDHPGRCFYDTHGIVTDGKGDPIADLRLIAFRLPNGIHRAEKYIRNQGLNKVRKALKRVWHQRFHSEEEARAAAEEALASADADAYEATLEYGVDPKAPEGGPRHMVRVLDVRVVEERVRTAAENYSVEVLITNIPFATVDAAIPRRGMTSDSVIGRYLAQAVVEKRFRMMKTCHGMAHVFIHTPVRQDAMIVMDGICTSIQSAMDARFKLRHKVGNRHLTVERLYDELVSSRVGFDREEGRIYLSGDPESRRLFFEAVDMLGVDLAKAFPYA